MRQRPGPFALFLALLCVSAGLPAAAQGAPAPAASPTPASAATPPAPEEPAIADNSFLLEEAYNQEAHVVQHISVLTRDLNDGGGWSYGFTQEWPLRGLKHQLSYSVSLLDPGAGLAAGVGDAAVNYRYQWIGDGEAKLAVSPRATVLLPFGASGSERGAGGVGFQVGLPISRVLSASLTSHTNLGFTHTPRAKSAAGDQAAASAFNLGQSLVYAVSPRLNLMLEAVYLRGQSVAGRDRTEWADELFVSPGVRWAYNFASGLQIVPGLAVPIGVGPSSGEKALLVYLSFEHPFGKRD